MIMTQSMVLQVETLPIIDGPALESFDFDGNTDLLMAHGTKWNSNLKESVVCAIITACKIAGQWQPIDATDYFQVLSRYPLYSMMPQFFVDAMWDLVRSGDVQIVEYNSRQYIVATTDMINEVVGKLSI
jgi:hypothetical protein